MTRVDSLRKATAGSNGRTGGSRPKNKPTRASARTGVENSLRSIERSLPADGSPLSEAEEKKLLADCEAAIEKHLEGFVAVGKALQVIQKHRLHLHAGFKTFDAYVQAKWGFKRSRAYQLIEAAQVAENVHNCGQDLPVPKNEGQVRPLAKLKPADQAKVWHAVVEETPAREITAKIVEEKARAVAVKQASPSVFNEVNENNDWAKWSWNPVTGCNHGCDYCYARPIAERFTDKFPKGFKPDFRKERLKAPRDTKIPKDRKDEPGIHNVFVCSMADLFGDWVPAKWIDEVLKAVRDAPQWNFLFLAKNPKRLIEIDWPENAWVGATVDEQARVEPTIAAFQQIQATVRFISCEPLLEELEFPTLECFDWMIIGAQSKQKTIPEFQPDPTWVQSLMNQAWKAGVKLYLKPNLRSAVREYPIIDR